MNSFTALLAELKKQETYMDAVYHGENVLAENPHLSLSETVEILGEMADRAYRAGNDPHMKSLLDRCWKEFDAIRDSDAIADKTPIVKILHLSAARHRAAAAEARERKNQKASAAHCDRALGYLSRALDICDESIPGTLVAKIWRNRGALAQDILCDPAGAITCFDKAISHASRDNDMDGRHRAIIRKSCALHDLGRMQEARLTLESIRAEIDPSNRSGVQFSIGDIKLLLEEGHAERARDIWNATLRHVGADMIKESKVMKGLSGEITGRLSEPPAPKTPAQPAKTGAMPSHHNDPTP